MNWKDFFDRLGLDGTRWQWRILRWQNRWQAMFHAAEDSRQVITYPHKFCRACGSLIDREARACPQCGASAPSRAGETVRRTAGLLLPSEHPVTGALLFLNVLNLVVILVLFGFGQLLNPDSQMLHKMGALNAISFAHGEYWRLITYGFLHIGLLHIAFNLMALMQVGPFLEREIGSARFLAIYLLSLMGGGAAVIFFQHSVAGASGALFGLIGFGLTYAHFYGGPTGQAQRNFFLQWALYGFIFGFVVGADNVCHLGGFVTGAILGYLIERERIHRDSLTPLWSGVAWLCSLLTLAAFVWMLVAQL